MTRLCSIKMLIVCLSCFMSFGIAYGQNAFMDSIGATIRGEIIDTSPNQEPIKGVTVTITDAATGQEYIVTTDDNGAYEKTGLPAGRYMISISKKGYSDRIGKSKVVAAGGELYDRIKMRKKENIITFFQKQSLVWLLVVGITVVIIAAFVVLLIDLRKPRV